VLVSACGYLNTKKYGSDSLGYTPLHEAMTQDKGVSLR
jgi:hypothetical protein